MLTNVYLIMWFRGGEINFAFSLNSSITKLLNTLLIMAMEYSYTVSFLPKHYKLGAIFTLEALLFLGSIAAGTSVITLHNNAKALSKDEVEEQRFLRKVKKLMNANFWIAITAIGIYTTVMQMGQYYLVQKYGDNLNGTSYFPSFVTVFLTPFIGASISIIGVKLFWAQSGVLLGLTGLFLYTVGDTKHLTMLIAETANSLSYSFFYSSMMPVPGELVSTNQLSTAYGLSSSLLNLVSSFTGLISNFLMDNAGYIYIEMLHIVLLSIVFGMLSVLLTNNTGLNNLNIRCKRKKPEKYLAEFTNELYSYL